MILDSTNLLFNNSMILWPHSAQKYCCLGVCRGKSTFKRGNSAPWTRGILLEIKRLCELSTSVSFLIDQERLGCYGNQQSQWLKTQKFTSCSKSPLLGCWSQMLCRQLSSICWLGIPGCFSVIASSSQHVPPWLPKGKAEHREHPVLKVSIQMCLSSCFIGNRRSHGHT